MNEMNKDYLLCLKVVYIVNIHSLLKARVINDTFSILLCIYMYNFTNLVKLCYLLDRSIS